MLIKFSSDVQNRVFRGGGEEMEMVESPYSSLACPLLFLSSLVAVLSSLENNQRGVLLGSLLYGLEYTTIGVYSISEMR